MAQNFETRIENMTNMGVGSAGTDLITNANLLQYLNDGCNDIYWRYKKYYTNRLGDFNNSGVISVASTSGYLHILQQSS